MPITSTTTDEVNAPLPELDTSLADAPSYQAPTSYGNGQAGSYNLNSDYWNSYSNQNPNYAGVIGAYRTFLGRDPESEAAVQSWASNPNWYEGIRNSAEAQNLGRARNEVSTQITAKQQEAARMAQIERQNALTKLASLDPLYSSQLGELQFGLNSQQTALNAQLQQMLAEYGTSSTRLQEQYEPARIAALNAANRAGLLNSTIALDRLNAGFNPISRGLADLATGFQNQQNTVESKRQDLISKYLLSRENLVTKRNTEAQAIRDAYNLALQQAQQKQSELEAQRFPMIYARSGEIGDQLFQQNLQSRQLDELIRFQQEQNRLERERFEFGKSKA